MKKLSYKFSNSTTQFYFDSGFSLLSTLVPRSDTVLLTDENVFKLYQTKFRGWNIVVLKPGEEYKVQATVDSVISQLIRQEAGRNTFLVGVGGGVVTDITGYVASVYMRGLRFGFVPSSLLAMVDASIGGKNGIDVGKYKNMVGTIRQPEFLLYDVSLLKTLPGIEWMNGMAEIIKHACIKDSVMFRMLEKIELKDLQQDKKLLSALVERNARLKASVVKHDEFEKGERRLLNFGHTLGHAIENQYELSHGQAISIGMTYACAISSHWLGFAQTSRIVDLLTKFGLPTYAKFDRKKVFDVLKMDKKRERKDINYVMLEDIGQGVIQRIPMNRMEKMINAI